MTSVWPWWWLALPLLLLPIWWHRQKRERQQTEPLASARFLPATAPQQQRVWRWTETLLLLLRCVLLSVLIAWLADTVLAWRGDTVLLAPELDAVWAEQQIKEAGMASAERLPICSPAENCAAILDWVAQHERAWRPSARLLLLAKAEQLPLTAHLPQLAHPLILRVQEASTGSASSASSAPTPLRQRHITLVTNATRRPQWLALFAAFELAGTGSPRTVFDSEPNAQTELLIWDDATSAPPTNWRAPLWWIAAAPVLPEAAQTTALRIEGIDLRYADSARGRFWFSSDWPPRDAQTLRGLYASWQLLTQTTAAYPVTNQTLPAPIVHSASAAANFFTSLTAGSAGSSHAGTPSTLVWLLIILFVMERGLAYARRI